MVSTVFSQHKGSGAVASCRAVQWLVLHEGPEFNPWAQPRVSFCAELACFPHVCVGFLP